METKVRNLSKDCKESCICAPGCTTFVNRTRFYYIFLCSFSFDLALGTVTERQITCKCRKVMHLWHELTMKEVSMLVELLFFFILLVHAEEETKWQRTAVCTSPADFTTLAEVVYPNTTLPELTVQQSRQLEQYMDFSFSLGCKTGFQRHSIKSQP